MNCPCHSGKFYSDCCETFHQGKIPSNALMLMRSRYSAYALNLSDYVINTTHPDNPQFQQNNSEWSEQISEFAHSYEFIDLKILEFIDGSFKSIVHFVAFMKKNNQIYQLNEKSLFYKVKGKWLYHSPLSLD
jgi:SEC-C motif-containing protein